MADGEVVSVTATVCRKAQIVQKINIKPQLLSIQQQEWGGIGEQALLPECFCDNSLADVPPFFISSGKSAENLLLSR